MIVSVLATLVLFQDPGPQRVERSHPELIDKYLWKESKIPQNGSGSAQFQAFDEAITKYMRETGAPGCGITVFFKGKMVVSKGFGFADIDAKTSYLPTTPNRVSSVSKYFTQKAIGQLVKDRKLKLSDKILPILAKGGIKPRIERGKSLDKRINNVTVGQLLEHKGGIQPGLNIADVASDETATRLRLTRPISHEDAFGIVLGMPLDNNPGDKESYSNYGYGLLGKIIQIVSGLSQEKFIRERVVKPVLGSADDWYITSASRKDRRIDEPDYYSWGSQRTWDVFRWDIMAGAGGWVTSSRSLAEFFSKEFPGTDWDFTLWGSYIGAVTVMKIYPDGLAMAVNVNYRSGIFTDDNEKLTKILDETVRGLKL